jgi:nucleotide-binding universal stress UspA family protein
MQAGQFDGPPLHLSVVGWGHNAFCKRHDTRRSSTKLKILIAVDGSDHANRAVVAAAKQSGVINEATKIAKDRGLPMGESIRAFGNVALEIVRAANERQSDLFVMGTRGAGALSNMLLGSVAQKVLHDSPVPVVLVK